MFSNTSFSELPVVAESAIAVFFRKLSFDNVMTALNLVIHHKIIRVVGSDRNEVFLCCEALHNLTFPFKR